MVWKSCLIFFAPMTPTTLNVKSIRLLCMKLMKRILTWNICVYFGFVELNFFMRHLHFLSIHQCQLHLNRKPTCMLLNAHIASWSTFGASSHCPILCIMNIFSPMYLGSPKRYLKLSFPQVKY